MKKSNLKTTALSTVVALSSLSMFFSCAPQKTSNEAFETISAKDISSIISGKLADDKFRKENGLVAIVMTEVTAEGYSQGICTGTLISKNIVLSAAHCFMPSTAGSRLFIGVYFENNITEAQVDENGAKIPLVKINADAIKVNDDYIKNMMNSQDGNFAGGDIALVRLSKDAPADYKFAKLPKGEDFVQVQAKSKLTLAGYGVTDPIVAEEQIDPETSEKVRVELPVGGDGVLRSVSNISVISVDTENKEILLKQATPKTVRGACHGDSGGPAFMKKEDGTLVQVGVTSRGTERLGNCNDKAIYTDVAAQLSWIEQSSIEILKIAAPVAAAKTPAPTPEPTQP